MTPLEASCSRRPRWPAGDLDPATPENFPVRDVAICYDPEALATSRINGDGGAGEG